MLVMPLRYDSKRLAGEVLKVYHDGKHRCSVYVNVNGSYDLFSRKGIILQKNMTWADVMALKNKVGPENCVSLGK